VAWVSFAAMMMSSVGRVMGWVSWTWGRGLIDSHLDLRERNGESYIEVGLGGRRQRRRIKVPPESMGCC